MIHTGDILHRERPMMSVQLVTSVHTVPSRARLEKLREGWRHDVLSTCCQTGAYYEEQSV
jgi:hypothetical protein